MQTREDLHHLVDALPDSELSTAARFLAYLRDVATDPFLRALVSAKEDNELEVPEEAVAVQEGRADVAAGRLVSHDEVRRRLLGES